MLEQLELIARVREVCAADEGLDAALMYGSFAAGEGDEHSDVEFWLFFTPEGRAALDPGAWCSRLAPLNHLVRNEFGTHVAFFPRLLRGEFHFATTAELPSVADWPSRGAPVERMVVLDRRGALTPVLRALLERAAVPTAPWEILELCGRYANWLVLATHVAARGEWLRAWDALGHVQRHLLWMTRLAEADTQRGTQHWLTPSRAAETELPAPALASLRASTAPAEPAALHAALRAAWARGRALWLLLAARADGDVPAALFAEIDALLGGDAGVAH